MRRIGVCLLSLLLHLAPPAKAQVPLLGLPGVAGLNSAGQREAARYLAMNRPRAFAMGPNGAYGWQSGGREPEQVEAIALANCQRRTGGAPCHIVARDLTLRIPGREWSAPAVPATQPLGGFAWEALPDPRFLWWGPASGRGVLLFAHGRAARGADSRGGQPQNWTRHFNNNGYDIWRFDRHPASDETQQAAGWMRRALTTLRSQGYRHIVVAGQSRGGWNTLMMLDQPGLADVHIAIAPAAHGDTGSPSHLRQLDELRGIVGAAAGAGRARLAIASFRDDPFDADTDRRAALFRELGGRAGAFLFIDRPERPVGHGGGNSAEFSYVFGPCLLRFATEPNAPSAC